MADPQAPSFPQVPRRIVVAVFVAVCALLALGYYSFLRTDYAVLYSGLKPGDASAIVAQLDAKGISHRLRDQGSTILVPSDQTDSVRLAVAGSDIPMKGAVGFELFNKSDMGLTDFAQKINYQRALQGELARTIMSMDGIDSARVHLAIPERSLYRGDHASPKAAVEVIARAGRALTPDRVAGIQQLVASAVPDLALGDVSILDADGRIVSAAPTPQAVTTPELEERSATQAYYSARAKAAIAAQLPGLKFDVRTLVLAAGDDDADRISASSASPVPSPAAAGQRDFRLRMTVLTLTVLDPDEQAHARSAAASAVALDEARGDTMTFELGPIVPPVAPVPHVAGSPAVAASPADAIAATPDTMPGWVGWAGGIVAVLALLVTLLLRRRAPSLSSAQRADFIERLRAELRTSEASDVRA